MGQLFERFPAARPFQPDALGNLVRFNLLPGHRYDTIGVAPLIEGVEFDGLIADKAFDANWIPQPLMLSNYSRIFQELPLLLMARTILKEVGLETPEEPLAKIKGDALFQQVDALRKLRSARWMQAIGYTREKVVPPGPLGDAPAQAARERADMVGQHGLDGH